MPTPATNPTFSLNPMLWLALCFAAGIVFGHFVVVPITTTIVAIFIVSILAVLLRERSISTALILVAFVFAGSLCLRIETSSVSTDRLRSLYDKGVLISGDPVEIEGIMTTEPEPAPDGYVVEIETDSLRYKGQMNPASGKARLFLSVSTEVSREEFADLALKYGSRVCVACRLEREDRYLNPGVMMRTQAMDRQGIDATGTVKSLLLIENLGRESVFIPLAFALETRAKAIEGFRQTFSTTTAGVLIASILGNKYFLDKQTAEVFREGGTYHVLVISGLHITFIGAFVLLILRAFTSNRRLQAAATLIILWLFGIAVGGDAPVIRACLMFTVLMIGYASHRTSTLLNSLGVCVLALLVWQPSDLFDPSFQLTIVSVAAIVAIALPLLTKLKAIGSWTPTASEPFPPNVFPGLRRFCEMAYWNEVAWKVESGQQIWSATLAKTPIFQRKDKFGLGRTLTFIFEGFTVSLVVQVCMLPLLVYYFHRVSLVSIPLNLWVGSVLAVESIFAVAATIVGMFSGILATPLVTCTEVLNWLLIEIPGVITDNVWASVRVPIYGGILRAVYLIYLVPPIMISLLLIRWNPFSLSASSRWTKLISTLSLVSLAALAGTIVFHPFSSPRPDSRLHVEFLDVGQGDAAFITLPSGKTMLVDAGGRMNYNSKENEDGEVFEPDVPRIGEAVVSEFLWERGLSHIDVIVATHADTDHVQGLADVANNFSIGAAYFGRMDTDDPDMAELISILDERDVPRRLVAEGETFEIDGIRMEVLNPFRDGVTMSANNDSVVLRIVHGDVSFLLTGDIEREAEDLILRSGSDLLSTVIKVPHHGSRTSSTQGFVDAVDAGYAVISVGKHSIFSHPHPEVVERWKSSGSQVMTTGENGTISFSTDGQLLDLQLFIQQDLDKTE